MSRKVALALGSAGLSVAMLGGVAMAAMAPASNATSAVLEPLAGQALAQENGDPFGQLGELLQKLVAEGKLTAEQRATIEARLSEALAAKRRAPSIRNVLGQAMKTAATYLGIDEKALHEQLRAGKSLGEIADTDASATTTRTGLIAAILADADKRIDEAVTNKKLTAEQAAKVKEAARAQAAKLVDAKRTAAADKPKADKPKLDRPKPDANANPRALIGQWQRTAREYLGITEKALQEQLRAGKSLGEIADTDASATTTRAGLIAAYTTAANAKIDQQKANGALTEAAATKAKQGVAEAAAKIVDAKTQPKRTTVEKDQKQQKQQKESKENSD